MSWSIDRRALNYSMLFVWAVAILVVSLHACIIANKRLRFQDPLPSQLIEGVDDLGVYWVLTIERCVSQSSHSAAVIVVADLHWYCGPPGLAISVWWPRERTLFCMLAMRGRGNRCYLCGWFLEGVLVWEFDDVISFHETPRSGYRRRVHGWEGENPPQLAWRQNYPISEVTVMCRNVMVRV